MTNLLGAMQVVNVYRTLKTDKQQQKRIGMSMF